MKNSEQLISLLQEMNQQKKYICAMCAAPIVLEKANLLIDKQFTAYQGYDQNRKRHRLLRIRIRNKCIGISWHNVRVL